MPEIPSDMTVKGMPGFLSRSILPGRETRKGQPFVPGERRFLPKRDQSPVLAFFLSGAGNLEFFQIPFCFYDPFHNSLNLAIFALPTRRRKTNLI